MDVKWTKVSGYSVAWSEPGTSKNKKRIDVEGYEDVFSCDLPSEIKEAAKTHGWTNFGWIKSDPTVFIAASTVGARTRIARYIKESSGSGHSETSNAADTAQHISAERSVEPDHSNQHSNSARHLPEEPRGRPKDGGIKVFFDSGTLHIEADRYEKKGADPDAMLESIFQVVDASEGFLAAVRLQGLWWSEGTYETKHDSSTRCLKVLSGLFDMGCRGLTGDLDLSRNDLDDEFLRDFLQLVENSDCRLDSVNLDENRITTDGATNFLRGIARSSRSRSRRLVRLVQLMNNPVDNCRQVDKAARSVGVECRVGPEWTTKEAQVALRSKNAWWTYFYGPVQLLRCKLLELEKQMQWVECPICDCVLKHDLSASPKYTVTGNLASHLCGDGHRKNIASLLKEGLTLSNILIVSPMWSFTLHPLTGELQWARKQDTWTVRMPSDNNSYQVHVRAEAASVRAMAWQEGRESMASEKPDMAFEILEHLQSEHRQETNQSCEDCEVCKLNVRDIEFTQASIKNCFRDGRYLEDLISDLDQGKVDPSGHRNLQLEVVQCKDKFYSNDNRRLFCLKEHQKSVDWNVKVRAKVHRLPAVFDRFIDRFFERWQLVGNNPDYIRVRGRPPRPQPTPPWRSAR